MTSIAEARAQFDPVRGYLNAASLGLPPRPVVDTLTAAIRTWHQGAARAPHYDSDVAESRRLYAGLVGVPVDRVAVGAQVSVMAGMVASALPDGARVICVDGDFSSMVFPFLVHADRGVSVRHVPLRALAEEIGPGTDLVVFSLAMSSNGELADAGAVVEAARRVGARTCCDLTQAVGWLPVEAGRFDVTVCAAYKWLCAPRGTAFMTLTAEAAGWIRPTGAGWYAGHDVWASAYGPAMRLAEDARRFDVSPAWLPFAGTVPALRLFAGLDIAAVRAHDADLADRLRAALDMEPAGRPVVALADPDGERADRLRAAGVAAATRAGGVRIAFHLWNDPDDVELAAAALRPVRTR